MEKDIIEKLKVLKKLPPDGGWGWMIVIACIIFNANTLPLFVNFGILYHHKIDQFQLTGCQITIIMNISTAITISLAQIAAPLLKALGCRKMAILGGLIFSAGIILSSFVTQYAVLLICIIFSAIGIGLGAISFSLALSTYFLQRHSMAYGISVLVSGILESIYPYLIVALQNFFKSDQCIVIIGALSLNTILAAYLLQPIKWHLKDSQDQINNIEMSTNICASDCEAKVTNEIVLSDNRPQQQQQPRPRRSLPRTRKFSIDDLNDHTIPEEDDDAEETITEILITRKISTTIERQTSIEYTKRHEITTSAADTLENSNYPDPDTPKGHYFQMVPCDSINMGSMFNIFLERPRKLSQGSNQMQLNSNEFSVNSDNNNAKKNEAKSKKKPKSSHMNLLFGLSFSMFSDINFFYLLPFILLELNYTNLEIATAISIIEGTEIICQVIGSSIGSRWNTLARPIYTVILLLIIFARTGIIHSTNFRGVLIGSFALGVVKGIRNIYVNLILPTYITNEKLPFACRLQVILTCILFILLGPFVGGIKDLTGNFAGCVSFLNLITLIAFIIWLIEIVYIKCRGNK